MRERLIFAGVLLLALSLHLLFLKSPVDRDEGFYMTAGRLIAGGKVLYRDIFDFKPPAMHYTAALLYKVAGNSFIGFRLLIICVNLVSAVMVYETAKFLWNGKTGVLAAFLFTVGLPVYEGMHFLSEQFVVLFGGAGLLFYLKSIESGRASQSIYCGLLLGVSVMYKQVGVFILFWILLDGFFIRKNRNAATTILVSSMIPAAVFLAYFSHLGVLGESAGSVLSIAARYRQNPLGEVVEYSYKNFMGYPLLWALSATSFVVLLRGGARSRDWVINILFTLSLIPVVFKQFPHYYFPALYLGSMLAGKTMLKLVETRNLSNNDKTAFYAAITAIAILIIPTLFYVTVQYHYLSKYGMLDKFLEASEYIKENTLPSEKILVAATEPQIYFLSERDPPTRYLHLDYSDYYDGIEEDILTEADDAGVRYFVLREDQYLAEYANGIRDFAITKGELVLTVEDEYPIMVYRISN